MKNILLVFGTRPEAIKMAPLAIELSKDKNFTVKVCVTGQHREMLDQVLEIFSLKPDYDLGLMNKTSGITDLISTVIKGLNQCITECNPDIILVHGDTTTTLGAAIAGFYSGVRVGHVEAGLRTGNLNSPWPEEGNRKMVGSIAAFHFAPTESAKKNLLRESILPDKVWVTGNTVVDALQLIVEKIESSKSVRNSLESEFEFIDPKKKLILVTGHRRESFDGGLERIFEALRAIALECDDVQIVYPVHLNPKVQEPAKRILSSVPNIRLIEPQSYLPFVYLMMRSYIIVTDSGGIQEEAPALGKPVLVTRDNTERPEAVEAGTVKLVGTDTLTIIQEIKLLLTDRNRYLEMSQAHNPYGTGQTSLEIRSILQKIVS